MSGRSYRPSRDSTRDPNYYKSARSKLSHLSRNLSHRQKRLLKFYLALIFSIFLYIFYVYRGTVHDRDFKANANYKSQKIFNYIKNSQLALLDSGENYKLTIGTLAFDLSPQEQAIQRLSDDNKRYYAKLHKYNYHLYYNRISKTYGKTFNKLLAIRDLLHYNNFTYKWVIWMGPQAFFVNMDIDFRKLIRKIDQETYQKLGQIEAKNQAKNNGSRIRSKTKSIFFVCDQKYPFSSLSFDSVVLIKNTKKVRQVFEDAVSFSYYHYHLHPAQEEWAIYESLYQNDPKYSTVGYLSSNLVSSAINGMEDKPEYFKNAYIGKTSNNCHRQTCYNEVEMMSRYWMARHSVTERGLDDFLSDMSGPSGQHERDWGRYSGPLIDGFCRLKSSLV